MRTDKAPQTSASLSTQLADATDNSVSTINPSKSMTKYNSINPTPAVNSNDSVDIVDTINTDNTDNLFNDEQNTLDAPITSKQQRIGKQQRKSDFADFKETYLMPSKLIKRHSVNIEESVWEQLERVARILGDRGSNVGSYINAILVEHLKLYADDIEIWRKL